MGRQFGMGLVAAIAALFLLVVAMWALSPTVKQRERANRKVATTQQEIEPEEEAEPEPATPTGTGRGHLPPTKPGERVVKTDRPIAPYMLPILDDFTPGGPPTSPEAMKTPEG